MVTERLTRQHQSDKNEPPRSVSGRPSGAIPSGALRHQRLSRRAGLLLLLAYVVMRLNPVGSSFDESLRGDRFGSGFWFDAAGDLLALMTPLTVGAVATVVAAVVWRRRGRWVAAQTLAVTALAPGLAEVLKVVLPTWSHHDYEQLVWGGSFPSGHTAVTTALLLGAISLIPAVPVGRARLLQAVAFVPPVVVALSTVVVGWHEPSDTIGGALLALAVHHGVSAIRMRRGH